MKRKNLKWVDCGVHHITGKPGTMICIIPRLANTVSAANYEVHQSYDGWYCRFWHGNMGHLVAVRLGSKEDAMQSAEKHLIELYESLKSVLFEDTTATRGLPE